MSDLLTLVPPAVLVLLAAAIVPFVPRRAGHTLGTASLLSVVGIALFAPEGAHYQLSIFGAGDFGFDVVLFNIDSFSRALGAVFGTLGAAAVIYAYSSGLSRVTTAFALSYAGSTMGLLFAGDWLTLLLFWEFMAVTSTLLVWHHGGKAIRAGYRYALAHGIGGSLLLFGVGWHYAEAGTFLFEAHTAVGAVGHIADGWPLILAVLGIGVNCGFILLHTWLPDTYPSPHFAASVFLSVFTTKTAAYVMYRALPSGEGATLFGEPIPLLVGYMGGFMAVYGVVFALLQHDMRALLSYHIQAQVGYMLAGIGVGLYLGGEALSAGVGGAMLHAFNNVLFKALLFMAVGVVIYRTGINDLYELGGLWRQMPLAAAAFALGALSITAVPPFNGFISKGLIFDATHTGSAYVSDGFDPIYYLLFIGAIGTFLSFIKLGYYVFLHGEWDGPDLRDARPGHSIAMFSIGGLCLVFGILWQFPVDLFGEQLQQTTGADLVDVAAPFSPAHLQDAAVLGGISVIAFPIVRRILYAVGDVRDPATVVNPASYYAGKGGVYAVTESYAAIDRAGVRLVRLCYWAGKNPVLVVIRASRYLPSGLRPDFTTDPEATDGGVPSRLYLRADAGATVLIVTVVLTLLLVVVLL